MSLRRDIGRSLRDISKIRVAEFLMAALVMALLTLFIGDLPELEVVESTVNDDSFSDLVVTTRGELSIDTSIVVVTYGPEILDDQQRVDRALLAQGLLYLMTLEPAVVGVDFMIDDLRPESPEGDEMLAGVIDDYRDRLIFGIYSIDSLGMAPAPPPTFSGVRLGSVNLMPGDDRVIRTFTESWPGVRGEPTDLLSVKVAEEIDPEAVAYLRSFSNDEFVIDYAAGLGEHVYADEGKGLQVFPSIPLTAIADAIFSEESDDDDALRRLIGGKAVLVGYADLRQGQVNSIVDRFWTPLKPEKNALPDMHGVAIHANILNTILQRRIVTEVPAWVNVLWGMLVVFMMYVGHAAFGRIRPERFRTMLRYAGWVTLLLLALLLPIYLFRVSPYKLSVYTPFAGLILGRLVITVYDQLKRFIVDAGHRRAIRGMLEPENAAPLLAAVGQRDPRERYVALLHVIQQTFHTAADYLFIEAAATDIAFRAETVGSPTPGRLLDDIEKITPEAFSPEGKETIEFIRKLVKSLAIQEGLRAARSLVIAVNEIDRQTILLNEEAGPLLSRQTGHGDHQEARDTVMMAVSRETTANAFDESDRLLREFLQIRASSTIRTRSESPHGAGLPFILTTRCSVHELDEEFIYLSEQEDANNQDDFHDLIYSGNTIRCRPDSHPGLTEFRRLSRSAVGTPGEPSIPVD